MEGVGHPYYKTKLAAEAVVREGIAPWSILRATQFDRLMEIFLGIFSTAQWLEKAAGQPPNLRLKRRFDTSGTKRAFALGRIQSVDATTG